MSLSADEIDAIAERLFARLRAAPPASVHDLIGCEEAMRMVKAGSPRALYRTLAKLGVRRVTHGRYRRGDIENAISRATLRKGARK